MKSNTGTCLTGSILAHLAGLGLLLLGAAFGSRQETEETVELRLVDVIPTKVVDAAFSGGGVPTPLAATPPKTPPSTESTPPPKQQPVVPKPVEPQRSEPTPAEPKPVPAKPEPIKPLPDPVKQPKVQVAKDAIKSVKESPSDNPDSVKPVTRKIEVAKTVVKPSASELEAVRSVREQQRREREAAELRQRAIREGLASAAKSALSGASSLDKRLTSTKIEMPSGSGGEAYINYNNLLYNIYKPRWDRGRPDAVVDSFVAVKAAVTIERTGVVLSSRILQPSGIPAVDKAADRVLKSVTFTAPFPETTKDSERIFTINFTVEGR